MGSVLGCAAAETASCFGGFACHCCSKMFSRATLGVKGSRSSVATRVSYGIFFLVNCLLAWFMLSPWAENKLQEIPYLNLKCPEGVTCHGVMAVYRICFALFTFHFFLALATWGIDSTDNWRASIQNGWWGPKIFIWIGLLATNFFIPNAFFVNFMHPLSLIASFLFILIQLLLLVDFAHSWSVCWVGKYEEAESDAGKRTWLTLLISTTVLLILSSFVLTGLLYGYFAKPGCTLNITFITTNLVLCLIAYPLSISPWVQEANPRSGILPSAIITLYANYLVYSSISNAPADMQFADDGSTCNLLSSSGSSQTVSVILGSLFTFCVIAYSTSSAATNSSLVNTGDEQHTGYQSLNDSATDVEQLENGVDDSSVYDDEHEGTSYSYSVFHVIFGLAILYVAMLMTNWASVEIQMITHPAIKMDYLFRGVPMSAYPEFTGIEEPILVEVGKSIASVWIKMASSWCVMLLYIWTLVAPMILVDREWS